MLLFRLCFSSSRFMRLCVRRCSEKLSHFGYLVLVVAARVAAVSGMVDVNDAVDILSSTSFASKTLAWFR